MVWYPRVEMEECLLWRGHPAEIYQDAIPFGTWFVDKSPRAGGAYYWGNDRGNGIRVFTELDESHKARITTWLVDQRRLGNTEPTITNAVIDDAAAARPLSVHERADRLLRFLADETVTIGQSVTLGEATPEDESSMLGGPAHILEPGRTSWLSMAHSESTEPQEVYFLLDYLDRMGWVEGDPPQQDGLGKFIVTVNGYRRIAEQETNVRSEQVFVAMWFDPSMDAAYDDGIAPAIHNTGYVPFRIDRKPDVDKIDDEIIGEIRRSRFLIADFTYGDKGIRGGVYYEAGFALGLGLDVIRSCREDQMDDLHFDVNHHYHIAWNTPEELRERLEKRILALVSEGPNRENIRARQPSTES